MRRALVSLTLILAACHGGEDKNRARQLTGGQPERGRQAIERYGCGACHEVPGVNGAKGLIGPPLTNIGERMVLAGQLPNTPENMMRWIRDPQKVDSGTAMPNLNVSEADARDIAAYLYTLRK
jgi:cytochrome c